MEQFIELMMRTAGDYSPALVGALLILVAKTYSILGRLPRR